jgi:pimeloyl-ACP methyl ester carboxylesterase
MKYFNGFSLQNEEVFFEPYLRQDAYSVAGFSYGAQQALEYVYHTQERVDRLMLLSPAFFQNQKESFLRMQLRYFQTAKQAYIEQFLTNVVLPASLDLSPYVKEGSFDQLESLLYYRWEEKKLQEVIERGTTIEVFLGGSDQIIDGMNAFDFFKTLCPTYLIKDAGHILKVKQ